MRKSIQDISNEMRAATPCEKITGQGSSYVEPWICGKYQCLRDWTDRIDAVNQQQETSTMGYNIPPDHSRAPQAEHHSREAEPLAGELNPDHPVTRALHNNWHAIAAVLVNKFGDVVGGKADGSFVSVEVVITKEDVDAMQADGAIVVRELDDGIHLRIVDKETLQELMRNHGALKF